MCVYSERREANIFHHGVSPPRVPPPTMARADIIDPSLPLKSQTRPPSAAQVGLLASFVNWEIDVLLWLF